MAEKTIGISHGEAVEMSSSPVEKSGVHHEESVAHYERTVGLRIDGDDLDHEHEPKVSHTLDPLTRFSTEEACSSTF